MFSIHDLFKYIQNHGIPSKLQSNNVILSNGVVARLLNDKKTYEIKDRVSNSIKAFDTLENAAKYFINTWKKYNLNDVVVTSSKMSLSNKIYNAKRFNTKTIKIKKFNDFCKLVLDNWYKGEMDTSFENEVRRRFKKLWNKKFRDIAEEEWLNLIDDYGSDIPEDEFYDSVNVIVNKVHQDSNYGDLRDAYEEWEYKNRFK